MYPKAHTVAFAAMVLTVLLGGTTASACGESLFRVGKGVAYRDYSAPLPGRILVVAKSEGELALVERLAAAGHQVHVVESARDIGGSLRDADYDIVMSLYAEHEIVESQTRASPHKVAYLPVAVEDSKEVAEARAINPHAPTTGDSVKTFLKAIHRTLKDAGTA